MSKRHHSKRGSEGTSNANLEPLGDRRKSFGSPQDFGPPTKLPRVDTQGSSSGSGHGAGEYVFAGSDADELFPAAKTTLNNALQVHLHRLNAKLDYKGGYVNFPGKRHTMYRASVDVPYPEPFTAKGEGVNRKDAEKRASAAACKKLYDLGIIDLSGRRQDKHFDVMEDQKPKQLMLPLAGQIELFDAVSCLPGSASFPSWASLVEFYGKKKKEIRYEEKGDSVFELKLSVADGATNLETGSEGDVSGPISGVSVPNSGVSDPISGVSDPISGVSNPSSGVSQSTFVTLPASLKRHFSTDGPSTPLASLPCPHCLRHLSLSLSHRPPASLTPSLPSSNAALTPSQQPPMGGSRPSLLPTPTTTVPTAPQPLFAPQAPPPPPPPVFCAFTGELYRELTDDEYSERNEVLSREQAEVQLRFANARPNSPQYTAQRLPVTETRNTILTEVNTQPVVIVSGMTGSGKTTQVPQFILENYIEHGMGAGCNVIVTQPRRISAISIAERVAAERGERVGVSVGYQVRLESAVPRHPGRILYCTTGILLMRLRKNPALKGVSHVIVDEVHERDINTDFLLILLREIVRSGGSDGVKVVLMSASMDSRMFAEYFRSASIPHVPCVAVHGRCFPVTDHHLTEVRKLIGWRGPMDEETADTQVDFVAEAVSYLTHSQPMGAILVFLPGWDDIMSVQDILKSKLRLPPHQYTLHLLHSMLSSDDQQQVFKVPPIGVRKIILATNIAESSVTIDDIVYVINTGTVKIKTFDPQRKISCLATQWGSKANVTQRRGRAGRCQPGHCYHLFTKEQFHRMADYQVPEIQRTPLEELVLQAKVLSPSQPVVRFLEQALSPPLRTAIYAAVSSLRELGALDDKEALTPMGKALAELPIEPRVGRLVLLGAVFGTLDPVLTIAASLGYKDPFLSPPTKRREADEVRTKLAASCYSDHLLLVRAHSGWRDAVGAGVEFNYIQEYFLHRGSLKMIEGLRSQFQSLLESLGFTNLAVHSRFAAEDAMVRAVLTAGLYPNVVRLAKMMESGGMRGESQRKRVRNGFKTLQDGRVFIHPSSVNSEKSFPSNWFVFYEKVKTSQIYIRDSTLVHPLHLLLFAGRSLDTLSQSPDSAVVGLDGREWLAFELPLHLANLLRCTRAAIAVVLGAGLRGHLGQVEEVHWRFLEQLNRFLASYTCFHSNQD